MISLTELILILTFIVELIKLVVDFTTKKK